MKSALIISFFLIGTQYSQADGLKDNKPPACKTVTSTSGLVPHKTSFCAGLFCVIRDTTGANSRALYPIRDLSQKLSKQLTVVQSRTRSLVDWMNYEIRQGADTSPTYSEVSIESDAATNGKTELALGKALGRLGQLEKDITDHKTGMIAMTWEIRGSESIENFLMSLRHAADDSEAQIAAAIKVKYPYWNNPRLEEVRRSLFGSAFTLAISGVTVAQLLTNDFNWFLTLSNLSWPFLFREHMKRAGSYIKSIFSESARDEEENNWWHRATPQLAQLEKIEQMNQNKNPDSDDFSYVGWNLVIPEQFAKDLINGTPATTNHLFQATAASREPHLLSRDTPSRVISIDSFFYRDTETLEPVLVFASRMMKTFNPPPPKKKKKQKEVKAPAINWGVEGSLNPIPIK